MADGGHSVKKGQNACARHTLYIVYKCSLFMANAPILVDTINVHCVIDLNQ